jgi:hypothetical protein
MNNCFLLDLFVVPTERITCGTNTANEVLFICSNYVDDCDGKESNHS